MLLNFKAELDAVANDGFTPAHMAAQVGSKEALEVLVEAGADLCLKTKTGKTVIELAKEKSASIEGLVSKKCPTAEPNP